MLTKFEDVKLFCWKLLEIVQLNAAKDLAKANMQNLSTDHTDSLKTFSF